MVKTMRMKKNLLALILVFCVLPVLTVAAAYAEDYSSISMPAMAQAQSVSIDMPDLEAEAAAIIAQQQASLQTPALPSEADAAQYILDVDLVRELTHHGVARTGVRLVARHGCSGVIEDNQSHVCLVINGIYDARYRRSKERGVADESETFRIGLYPAYTLRNTKACAHAKAGVYHIKRHGVA